MKSKYALTDAQVESLARDIVVSSEVMAGGRTTYLRVLVTRVQATLGKVRRGPRAAADTETQLNVLEDVSGACYAAVLRGITTAELEPTPGLEQAELTRRSIERNRRSTFARTSKSVLTSWVRAGGDMRTLDAESVTRDPLSAEVRAKRGVNGVAYTIDKHRSALLRLIAGEVERDPGGAREDIEQTMDALQAILDDLSPSGNTETGVITQVLRGRPAHTRQPTAARARH